MTEPVIIGNATLHNADCLDVLRGMADCSVDAVVTDPPAGISFMGKAWDHHKGGRGAWIAWMTEIATEVNRVLKPGGHALVWAIPRTSHWTATAWEDAGFEVRDRIAHCFGSGFPKSADVSKALDRMAGAEREFLRPNPNSRPNMVGVLTCAMSPRVDAPITAPATEAASQYAGYGTALKPAVEDWWLMRKPLDGTVAGNVLKWGVGGLTLMGAGLRPTAKKQAETDTSDCGRRKVGMPTACRTSVTKSSPQRSAAGPPTSFTTDRRRLFGCFR